MTQCETCRTSLLGGSPHTNIGTHCFVDPPAADGVQLAAVAKMHHEESPSRTKKMGQPSPSPKASLEGDGGAIGAVPERL